MLSNQCYEYDHNKDPADWHLTPIYMRERIVPKKEKKTFLFVTLWLSELNRNELVSQISYPVLF